MAPAATPFHPPPNEYFDQEWAGIARVLPNASRRDIVEPRAAYYRLQALWTGTEAQISVNPLTIDFGDVLLNSASEPKSITITNTGNRDLIIRSLKVLGGETEFEITPGTCESLKPMIPARSSCNVTAVFIPDSAGKETATLKLISNDHESPRTEVILKGTGVQARKYRISGGGFNDPQDAKYKATFSMDVTGPSNLSGSLRYYYAKNRLELVSTEITSVSISNNTAIITGKGKVNGVAGYVFTATIVDGSPDKFGLSINKLNGTPVYSVPPKAVSGGNLVLSGK
jgi:Abnormal spindle-like microcephaly-assoc'd, ASPM-SPD-2-Hydin